mgnify:CR=1 FL=1
MKWPLDSMLRDIHCVCLYPLGSLLKRPRTPPGGSAPGLDYQTADSEHLMKRARPSGQPLEEVSK